MGIEKEEILTDFDSRTRTESYNSMDEEDLFNMLKETKSLHEEADILHCLFELKFVYM